MMLQRLKGLKIKRRSSFETRLNLSLHTARFDVFFVNFCFPLLFKPSDISCGKYVKTLAAKDSKSGRRSYLTRWWH